MSMNPQQAAAEIVQALESSSGLKVSEEGANWVHDWCYGEGRGGEPRPDIFASDKTDMEINGLTARLALQGDKIVKLCVDHGVAEIDLDVLEDIEKEMSASGTRLCDPLLAAATQPA